MKQAVQTPPDDLITIENARPKLAPADRCDTCGARAYVSATVSGTVLLYCGHHATRYETRLRAAADEWIDERSRLYPNS